MLAAPGARWMRSSTSPEWVDWFNNRRLLEPIGHVPPAEFERAYCRLTTSLARAP